MKCVHLGTHKSQLLGPSEIIIINNPIFLIIKLIFNAVGKGKFIAVTQPICLSQERTYPFLSLNVVFSLPYVYCSPI